MSVNSNVVDFNLFIDEELATLFRKVTSENGVSAKDRMQEIDMILSTPGGSFL